MKNDAKERIAEEKADLAHIFNHHCKECGKPLGDPGCKCEKERE